ncbi:DUF3859 domain-containing protein [Vibrio scophthalmi]|uniref:hypothetical protein n=1 Tax=Vibrio scophthalmi TaxID=45658 RepID=UPI003873A597
MSVFDTSELEIPTAITVSPFKVTFNTQSIDSLRAGLTVYRHFLEQEEAFDDFYCRIRFCLETGSSDVLGELFDKPLVTLLMRYAGHDDKDIQPELSLARSYLPMESVFFLFACQHPQLEADIEATAKVMCQTSRRINNSSNMWISDADVFGLQALLMIAMHYPRLTYLLAGYIVPNWDTEHAPYGEEVLGVVASHLGYNEHTLKAFCYCDNANAQAQMFNLKYTAYDEQKHALGEHSASLLQIFREDPLEFERFRAALKERFVEQDFLQTNNNEREYCEKPIERIMLSIVSPISWHRDSDNNLETLSQTFIDSPTDDVAADLTLEIEQYLGRPIVAPKVIEEEPLGDLYYTWGTGEEEWKAFVCEGVDNGKALWHYIVSGENPQVLDTITPCDIETVAKTGNFKINHHIQYFTGPYECLASQLEHILYNLIADWTMRNQSGEPNEAEGRFKLFRMLDVIHRWNDKHPFHPDFVSKMVEEYQFFTDADFIARFNGDWRILFNRYVESFSSYSGSVDHSDAIAVYRLIADHREQVFELIMQADFADHYHLEVQLTACAAILNFDLEQGICDQLTQQVSRFLSAHLPVAALAAIDHYSHCDELQGYGDELTDEQKASYQQKRTAIVGYLDGTHQDQQLATTSLAAYQQCDSIKYQVNPVQPYYLFISHFHKSGQKLLVCADVYARYLAATTPNSTDVFSRRFLDLWLLIAPLKTAYLLSKFYVDEALETQVQYEHLASRLEVLSPVTQQAIIIERRIDDLSYWEDKQALLASLFDAYIAQSEEQNGAIEQALALILPRHRQTFMLELKKYAPQLTLHYFDQEIITVILAQFKRYITRHNSPAHELTLEQQQHFQLFNHYLRLDRLADETEISQLTSVLQTEHVSTLEGEYGEAELSTLFWFIQPERQANIMSLFAHTPQLALSELYNEREDDNQESKALWLCQRALQLGAEQSHLLTLMVKNDWLRTLKHFAQQDDIIEHLNQLTLEDLEATLIKLAQQGKFEPIINYYHDHRSRHIRDLIAEIQLGRYAPKPNPDIEIMDYGIYVDGHEGDEVEGTQQEEIEQSEFKTIAQLEHRQQSHLVEIELNRTFGVRLEYFSNDDNDDGEEESPQQVALTIRLHHPYIAQQQGYVSEWQSTIEVDCSAFIGWTMSHKSLCIPGVYRFDIFDDAENLIVTKTFHVMESRPIRVKPIIDLYQSNQLDKQSIGSVNLNREGLAIVAPCHVNSALNLSNRLTTNIAQVYCYHQNKRLALCEIELSHDVAQHWYPAANQLVPSIETRLKGKHLLLGTTAAVEKALAQPKLWKKLLTKAMPAAVFQPDPLQAENVIGLHLNQKGVQVLFGYSTEGELCRVLIVHCKHGLLRRFYLHMMEKLAMKTLAEVGPNPMI